MNEIESVLKEDLQSFIYKCDGETTKKKESPKLFFSFSVDSMKKMLCGLPPLSKLCIISSYKCDDRMKEVERILSKLGYKFYHIQYLGGLFPLENLTSYKIEVGTRAVLAVGGEEEIGLAKLIGKLSLLSVFAVFTTPAVMMALSEYTYYSAKKLVHYSKGAAVQGAIIDKSFFVLNGDVLAAAFGQIASKIISIFDWYFHSVVMGGKMVKNSLDALHRIIDGLFEGLDGCLKQNLAIADRLVDCGLRVLAITGTLEDDRFFLGGDTQLGVSVTSLYNVEKYPQKSISENMFLTGKSLFSLYGYYLKNKIDKCFVLPPNPLLRAERLTEYFMFSDEQAARLVNRNVDMSLEIYRFSEYREELSEFYAVLKKTMTKADKLFKRMYDDDGFSLAGYGGRADFEVCSALAPDIFKSGTMLTFLERYGVLDSYL